VGKGTDVPIECIDTEILSLRLHDLAKIKGAIAELLLRAEPDCAQLILLANLKDHGRRLMM
jgi:hypothetical protein